MTRLPVYEGTLDTPVGLAHLKDLALTHGFNANAPAFDMQSMLRPLLFVPPSMGIGVLLTKMQAERRHMALGTAGDKGAEDIESFHFLRIKRIGVAMGILIVATVEGNQ